jgi:hypothetical protein
MTRYNSDFEPLSDTSLDLENSITMASASQATFSPPYFPGVSIIQGSTFTEAPSNTLPTAENAARIFASKAVNDGTPLSPGVIPLSLPEAFMETRYWRLPVSAASIFAALIARLEYDSSKCENILLAGIIRDILDLRRIENYLPSAGLSGGSVPSGGSGRGGGGTSGGGGPLSGHGLRGTQAVVHRPEKAKRRLERRRVAAAGLAIVVNPAKRAVS